MTNQQAEVMEKIQTLLKWFADHGEVYITTERDPETGMSNCKEDFGWSFGSGFDVYGVVLYCGAGISPQCYRDFVNGVTQVGGEIGQINNKLPRVGRISVWTCDPEGEDSDFNKHYNQQPVSDCNPDGIKFLVTQRVEYGQSGQDEGTERTLDGFFQEAAEDELVRYTGKRYQDFVEDRRRTIEQTSSLMRDPNECN